MRQLLWKDLIFSKYTLLVFLPMISLLVPLYTTRGLPAGVFVAFVALCSKPSGIDGLLVDVVGRRA